MPALQLRVQHSLGAVHELPLAVHPLEEPPEEVLPDEEVALVQTLAKQLPEQQSPSPMQASPPVKQAHSKAELQLPVQQFASIEQGSPILIQLLHSPKSQIAVQQSACSVHESPLAVHPLEEPPLEEVALVQNPPIHVLEQQSPSPEQASPPGRQAH